MATNDFSNTAFWVSPNATVTEVKGIPNFFSKSMFGKTSELKTAAQIVVVSALVAVILRIFSRRRLKTRVWWDDVCTMAAVFFLVTNQTVFSMIDFLGMFIIVIIIILRSGLEYCMVAFFGYFSFT